jgi:hypothetical protein
VITKRKEVALAGGGYCGPIVSFQPRDVMNHNRVPNNGRIGQFRMRDWLDWMSGLDLVIFSP